LVLLVGSLPNVVVLVVWEEKREEVEVGMVVASIVSI